MSCRFFAPLLCAAALLFIALSVGSPLFLALGMMLLLIIPAELLAVIATARSLKTSVSAEQTVLVRGEDVRLKVTVECGGLLPVAPVRVVLRTTPQAPETVLTLERQNGRRQSTRTVFHASHCGVCRPGVERCVVEGLFGLFTMTVTPKDAGASLPVLPRRFQAEELTYAPGDPGMEALARATEDLSSPSDVRSYAPGDPMKKIHWKLSLRKRELLVRRFDEPALPDALVLMDQSAPRAADREASADLRDAMLETAASVLALPHEGHQVRLPLLGEHPVQLHSGMPLPMILEELARASFREADAFTRVLTMESRRMSRVGCLVIVTSSLTADLTEAIIRLRRMGPTVRVYLITADPDAPKQRRSVGRLQRAGAQVSYVLPEKL